MAISYPITLPSSPPPQEITIKAVAAVGRVVSPWTFNSQVQESQGQQWRIDVILPPMARAAAETWAAALISLNGSKGTMKVPVYGHGTARGTWAGTAQVMGASQTGAELAIDGLTASQTGICKAGDYFTLNDKLYKVLVDADSNGSGQTTLDIWPSLRSSPADNALLTVSNAYMVAYLTTAVNLNVNVAQHYGLGFSAFEAL